MGECRPRKSQPNLYTLMQITFPCPCCREFITNSSIIFSVASGHQVPTGPTLLSGLRDTDFTSSTAFLCPRERRPVDFSRAPACAPFIPARPSPTNNNSAQRKSQKILSSTAILSARLLAAAVNKQGRVTLFAGRHYHKILSPFKIYAPFNFSVMVSVNSLLKAPLCLIFTALCKQNIRRPVS